MSRSEVKQKTWLWSPSIFVYDTGACTKEEHDPAKAILYHRPRNAPVNARVAITGQLAGVIHFCKTSFSTPTFIRTKFAEVALKHYGRFVLMVCGKSREWAESRLKIVSNLFDSSTGGISTLWMENLQNTDLFLQKLTSLMDAIVFHALADANFEDGIFSSCSASTSLSSSYSPTSEILEDSISEKTNLEDAQGISSLWNRSKSQEIEKIELKERTQRKDIQEKRPDEAIILSSLCRELEAVPSLSLPKSGASSFLRAQQLLETCQQQAGVLAGSTSFQNRVLNTQVEADLQLILSTINDVDNEENDILQKKKPQFQLPKDVSLYNLNITQRALTDMIKYIPKISTKRGERKGLRNEAQNCDLSSLRSALQNQSLHSYPSSIPPTLISKSQISVDDSANCSESSSEVPYKMDSLMLCSKISRNADLLTDGRPSRSLPGSPRKIRVATMLPEVGSDSPELRYKVLTARRPKPGTSSHNTPKRVPVMRNGNFLKNLDGQNTGVLQRGNNLTAPSLKRKEFPLKPDQRLSGNNGIFDPESQMDKENINSLSSKQFGMNNEINIKNTKNKLNLHFAPDKVNRPSEDYEEESKISREINGNLSKDNLEKESLGSKLSLKSHLIDLNDDDEDSRSEDSEISVLELNSYIESKENGNRMFEEANRISPKSDLTESNGDSAFEGWAEAEQQGFSNMVTNSVEHQWTKVTIYIQKSSKMTLLLILDSKAAANQLLIYNVYRLASTALPEIQTSVIRTLEMSEEKEGDIFLQKSSSVLTSVDLRSLNTHLTAEAHQNFSKYSDLTELTLRDEKSVIWAHKNGETETFYQSLGACRSGLPIPSDVMARIPHRARRRLERDHGITIL